jgi:hypothetical protein
MKKSTAGALFGGAGSVALMLYAGLRVHAPTAVVVLFLLWVVWPFVGAAAASLAATRRSARVHAFFSHLVLIVATASVAVYAAAALGPGRPPTPFFVLTAPISAVILAVGYLAALIIERRRR